MNREQLIIIALILVVLYMMNSSSSKDTVQAMGPMMGPMGRIRYVDNGATITVEDLANIQSNLDGSASRSSAARIRLGDRDYGKGHFIRNHIRHNNRNNMFSGMMGACNGGEMKPMNIRREGFVACDGDEMKPMNIRRESFELDCSDPCNPGCGAPC